MSESYRGKVVFENLLRLEKADTLHLWMRNQVEYFLENFIFSAFDRFIGKTELENYEDDLQNFIKELTAGLERIESKYPFFERPNAEAIISILEKRQSESLASLYRLYIVLKDLLSYAKILKDILINNKKEAFLLEYDRVRTLLTDYLNSGGVKHDEYKKMPENEKRNLDIKACAEIMALKIKALHQKVSKERFDAVEKMQNAYLPHMRSFGALPTLARAQMTLDELSSTVQQDLVLRKKDMEDIVNDSSFAAAAINIDAWLNNQSDHIFMDDVNKLASMHSHLRYTLEKFDKEVEGINEKVAELKKMIDFIALRLHYDLPFIQKEIDDLLSVMNEMVFEVSERFVPSLQSVKNLLLRLLRHDFVNVIAENKKREIVKRKAFPVLPYLLSLFEKWQKNPDLTKEDIDYFIDELDRIRTHFYRSYYPIDTDKSQDIFLDLLRKDVTYEEFQTAVDEMDAQDLNYLHKAYLEVVSDFHHISALMDAIYAFLHFFKSAKFGKENYEALYIKNILESIEENKDKKRVMKRTIYSIELFLRYIQANAERFKKQYPEYEESIDNLREVFIKYNEASIAYIASSLLFAYARRSY